MASGPVESSFLKLADLIEARGKVSGFKLAQDLAFQKGSDQAATLIYGCAYGINELLVSSFKLHESNVGEKVLIDPWEVILNEISILFNAPMVVARVKNRHPRPEDNGFFVRTNVRRSEYEYVRGETLDNAERIPNALVTEDVLNQLDEFYSSHASSHNPDLPLSLIVYPWGENLVKAFEEEHSRYGEMLAALKDSNQLKEERKANYKQYPLPNPSLFFILGVITIALYHADRASQEPPEFVGSIEIFMRKLPGYWGGIDNNLLGHFATLLSLSSINRLFFSHQRPDDFDSYRQNPMAPLSALPSFREYNNDLEDYKKAISYSTNKIARMQTDSSLPEVFDDLYVQIGRLLEHEGYAKNDMAIAFVVPSKSELGELVGRYYFPPSFLVEVLTDETNRERAWGAISELAVSSNSHEFGLPLDLGLLGYVKDTLFPAITYNIEQDARAKSYEYAQQQQELFLFFSERNLKNLLVIEFPLVLFADEESKEVYPTCLIIFLDNDQPLTPRCWHHLYTVSYHARYALAKAFAAEVLREDQVQQLSVVVHDVDRMVRPFGKHIIEISEQLGKSDSATPGGRLQEEIVTLQTAIGVMTDVLQFAQGIANRRAKDNPKHKRIKVSQSLNSFQEMFDFVWPKSSWPGWEKPDVRFEALRGWGDEEPRYEWPQGALFTILWNLSANAENKYRILKENNWNERGASCPSISCHIPRPRLMGDSYIALATFHISYPDIDFWDPELQSASKGVKERCLRPERISCLGKPDANDCDRLNECGSWLHSKYFNSGNASLGRQGLRSCRKALEKWYTLLGLRPQGRIETVKAGQPVTIRFDAPLKRVPIK